MLLTSGQIQEISKGALFWRTGPEGGLIPERYSALQLDVYERRNEKRFRNARASAGVRLECRTDAEALRLYFRFFRGESRDWYGLDLYVDGCLYSHMEGAMDDPDHVNWLTELPAGEKLVTVYLPCLAGVEILELELKNASFFQKTEQKGKILFLGDSITQGLDSHFPSFCYAALVANQRQSDFLNQGNGGEIFNPEILLPLDLKPDFAVIAFGTNDWAATDRETVTRNATAFLDKFCMIWPDLPAVVLSPLWRGDRFDRRTDGFAHEEVEQILRAAAAAHPQLTVISGYSLMPKIEYLMQDNRLHPNDLGFMVYAKRLTQILDEMFPNP
jgi:hypothetical protein